MANFNAKHLFPSDTASNVSNEFRVSDEYMALVNVKGLPDCTTLLLEYRFGVDCDFSWEPVIWCDREQQSLCYPQTQMIIPIPGLYRFVLVDEFDEHITDPDIYNDVRMAYYPINPKHDISKYYDPCCACCPAY